MFFSLPYGHEESYAQSIQWDSDIYFVAEMSSSGPSSTALASLSLLASISDQLFNFWPSCVWIWTISPASAKLSWPSGDSSGFHRHTGLLSLKEENGSLLPIPILPWMWIILNTSTDGTVFLKWLGVIIFPQFFIILISGIRQNDCQCFPLLPCIGARKSTHYAGFCYSVKDNHL